MEPSSARVANGRSDPIDAAAFGRLVYAGAGSFTDDELAELALAADPETPLDVDAVPLPLYLGQLPMMLPQWYMPPALLAHTTRWRTALVIAIVVALVMIDAWGLCSTYGSVAPA